MRSLSVRNVAAVALFFLVISLTGWAQRSALTIPTNVGQLARQAATIVRGRVTAVQVEPHPELSNLTTVVVSLRVEESLKGNSESFLTFRQFVWDVRDKKDGAGYRKGQELLLLLNPISSYGLTSPAGMEQGRFQISRDAKGNATAVNGYGNAGLFSNLPVQAQQQRAKLSASAALLVAQHRSGPVPLTRLEEVIKQFAGPAR
jgi:hypothetical protein